LNLRILSLISCPIYTYDCASAKFSTNLHETDNSAVVDPDALMMHRRGFPGPVTDPGELRWFPGSPPHRNAQGPAQAGHYLAPNQVKMAHFISHI
jgi:hypothetical protein